MREHTASERSKPGMNYIWLAGLLTLSIAAALYVHHERKSVTESQTPQLAIETKANQEAEQRLAAQSATATKANQLAELRLARRNKLLGMHAMLTGEFTRPRVFHHEELKKMAKGNWTVESVSDFFKLTTIDDQGVIKFPTGIQRRFNMKVLVADELHDITPSSQRDDQILAEIFLNADVDRIRIRTDITGSTSDFTLDGELLKAFKETLELAQILNESPMNGAFGSEKVIQIYRLKTNARRAMIQHAPSGQGLTGSSTKTRLNELLDMHQRITDDFTRPREFRHKKLTQQTAGLRTDTGSQAADYFLRTSVNDQGTVITPWKPGGFIRVLIGDDLYVINSFDYDNQALAGLFLYSDANRIRIKTNLSGDIVEFTAEGELLKAFRETVELAELLKESPMK